MAPAASWSSKSNAQCVKVAMEAALVPFPTPACGLLRTHRLASMRASWGATASSSPRRIEWTIRRTGFSFLQDAARLTIQPYSAARRSWGSCNRSSERSREYCWKYAPGKESSVLYQSSSLENNPLLEPIALRQSGRRRRRGNGQPSVRCVGTHLMIEISPAAHSMPRDAKRMMADNLWTRARPGMPRGGRLAGGHPRLITPELQKGLLRERFDRPPHLRRSRPARQARAECKYTGRKGTSSGFR
jgi:hypothetical protein